jgi:hypothetical protein
MEATGRPSLGTTFTEFEIIRCSNSASESISVHGHLGPDALIRTRAKLARSSETRPVTAPTLYAGCLIVNRI